MKVPFKRLKTVNVQQKQCQNSFNSILLEEDSMSDVYENIDEREDEDSEDDIYEYQYTFIVLSCLSYYLFLICYCCSCFP